MKVIVSCIGKFHAFALSEQLEKHNFLEKLYTSYSYQKDVWFRRLAKRVDRESITKENISTNILVAFRMKLIRSDFSTLEAYDKWVAAKLSKSNADVFIGWSGMSLHSLKIARERGMHTILERGSSHILSQNEILTQEYKSFGLKFEIESKIIEKELTEYEYVDHISIPSSFVRRSFIEQGINSDKIIQNPYGSSTYFKPITINKGNEIFRILYVGSITIRKGLKYFFESLQNLDIADSLYEVWFIGNVSEEMKSTIEKYKKQNWVFYGHINHYDLPNYICQCDVAVQPSLEEGLSMVIPQIMSCGIPMIVSTNTGGEDIIEEGINGYVVPTRDSKAISECISKLFHNKDLLDQMKSYLRKNGLEGFAWDDYGKRYISNIRRLIN